MERFSYAMVLEGFSQIIRIWKSKFKFTVIVCGGGISATLDSFLLYQLGFNDLKIYDNSMSEWAKDDSLPIEKD